MHQLWDHPCVFDDPLAVAIAGAEISGATKSRSMEMRHRRALMAARSRYAEDELNAAVARGAAQYVIVGAGLDTYAYRNGSANLRVFEVDYPSTQAWKRACLKAAGIAIPPSLVFVPGSFDTQNLPALLESAGFQAGQVSFFSWLAFPAYASAQATLATLAFIGSLPAGSGVVFDYTARRSGSDPTPDLAEETAMDALASRFGSGFDSDDDSQQMFVDSRALDKLLRSAGFQQVEDLGTAEIDERYFHNRIDGLRVAPGLVHLVSARVSRMSQPPARFNLDMK